MSVDLKPGDKVRLTGTGWDTLTAVGFGIGEIRPVHKITDLGPTIVDETGEEWFINSSRDGWWDAVLVTDETPEPATEGDEQ